VTDPISQLIGDLSRVAVIGQLDATREEAAAKRDALKALRAQRDALLTVAETLASVAKCERTQVTVTDAPFRCGCSTCAVVRAYRSLNS
jgi:hypothetical protein